jgi:hypothetical protein
MTEPTARVPLESSPLGPASQTVDGMVTATAVPTDATFEAGLELKVRSQWSGSSGS